MELRDYRDEVFHICKQLFDLYSKYLKKYEREDLLEIIKDKSDFCHDVINLIPDIVDKRDIFENIRELESRKEYLDEVDDADDDDREAYEMLYTRVEKDVDTLYEYLSDAKEVYELLNTKDNDTIYNEKKNECIDAFKEMLDYKNIDYSYIVDDDNYFTNLYYLTLFNYMDLHYILEELYHIFTDHTYNGGYEAFFRDLCMFDIIMLARPRINILVKESDYSYKLDKTNNIHNFKSLDDYNNFLNNKKEEIKNGLLEMIEFAGGEAVNSEFHNVVREARILYPWHAFYLEQLESNYVDKYYILEVLDRFNNDIIKNYRKNYESDKNDYEKNLHEDSEFIEDLDYDE